MTLTAKDGASPCRSVHSAHRSIDRSRIRGCPVGAATSGRSPDALEPNAQPRSAIRAPSSPLRGRVGRRRRPAGARFYVPNTKSEVAISSTLAEMIESSKFRSASAIRKKPLKFKHARQVFTDLGDLKLVIGSYFKFECSKDPDVKQAADLLMELSSSAASSSSGSPIWSDEMYSWPQPEVVRLKMRGMPEICVS